jgi:TatA/E family protein of Tat protein translocase
MIRRNAEDARMIAFVNQWELIVILVVVLLLFGHRLPGMARALGSGITEFKRGLKDGNATKNPDGPANPPARNPDAPNDGPAR